MLLNVLLFIDWAGDSRSEYIYKPITADHNMLPSRLIDQNVNTASAIDIPMKEPRQRRLLNTIYLGSFLPRVPSPPTGYN